MHAKHWLQEFLQPQITIILEIQSKEKQQMEKSENGV